MPKTRHFWFIDSILVTLNWKQNKQRIFFWNLEKELVKIDIESQGRDIGSTIESLDFNRKPNIELGSSDTKVLC